MKAIKTIIGGEEYYLYFNASAMFALDDIAESFIKDTMPNTREAYELLCKGIHILIEQGELARRYYGHTPKELPSAEQIEKMLAPKDIPVIKKDMANAIALGFGQEIQDKEKEVDLVLQELNQKKTTK
jgi:hypothetical protein